MTDFDFGITKERSRVELARAYGEAAAADGWAARATYESHEDIDQAASLEREEFRMQILSRDKGEWGHETYQASLHIWGPDGMVIKPPDTYDFEAIKAGLTQCNNCDKQGVVVHRYSFAGRCCEECLPAMRRKHEYPGWTK